MFDPTDRPRVFGLPPGADFAAQFVAGLTARHDDLSRVRIFVNAPRMARQINAAFDAGPPRLLPRVELVTDLSLEGAIAGLAAPVSPLRRRLELSRAVAALMAQAPDLAPRAALYDLSDSLALLMDEMHGEGVDPARLSALDVGEQSGHWQRSLQFLTLLQPYFATGRDDPDVAARQRMVVEDLIGRWQIDPPRDPVIVAGSTGSRGATALLMQAVARLPQGALVLPGFDHDMPQAVWDGMDDALAHEDHPQFRYVRLLQALDLRAGDVAPWTDAQAPAPARNRLISLSLRPAPVTDQWRADGATLGDLRDATAAVTLVETDSPRAEAEVIALRLRQAAAEGRTAALITPDRMLTRQVAAALDRWQIRADDSAGLPLALSAPGRLLTHVVEAMGGALTAEALLVLLKHPLTHTGSGKDRNQHLLWTRDLELRLRRHGPPFITPDTVPAWVSGLRTPQPGQAAWAAWVAEVVRLLAHDGTLPIADHLTAHRTAVETIARGPAGTDTGELWKQAPGKAALGVCNALARDADAGGDMDLRDFAALSTALLAGGQVRDPVAADPRILIWGTLEARVGGADLVILGGLNDGVWPGAPKADPWLNRALRKQAGLLLPERQIGLSAHDFQQGAGAAEVWITRARRNAEAETVPSRWVNRLTNLMAGLPEQHGPEALASMRARGDGWIRRAVAISAPAATVPRAVRPAPCPPTAARPKEISVTQIKTLYRDPYAIYAQKVLRLRALNPLRMDADAPLKGTVYHTVLERLMAARPDATDPATLALFMDTARAVLAVECPWPTVRLQWLTQLASLAPPFLRDEAARQAEGAVLQLEAWGDITVPGPDMRLTCKADRIDATPDGDALIYDYKTGTVPTDKQQAKFDKQLLLEAAMVERGAFATVGPRPVVGAAFLGFNAAMRVVAAPLEKHPADIVWAELITFLTRTQARDWGYVARRAPALSSYDSDYDHLSRFGEWTDADYAVPLVLT
ncbi:double-strand break repair protein AddB [Loktanella fryxellensis]|uniref:Double-strand break repair protein AddB n=1 Tax=Loktanella fryxellensis TaxID=245187 RepID=A0A1H8E0H0_9RHOB|nr:double-strand break repair protein AddB [Loktanella fryxellensis]SEN12288.1 double-strand break repair protein AddB [Loktanella fryxellensis]